MDDKRFDALTQRLAAIRLTRSTALRGMVASGLTLVGLTTVAQEASAGKKKNVCHCTETAGGTCATAKVKKKQRKAHLKNHQCDYLGTCRSSITACAAAPIFINIDLLGNECSRNSDCGGSNSGLLCDLGLATPVCVPIDLGNACTNNGECSTGRCEGGECVDCPEPSRCGSGASAQCCSLLATCGLLDVCVL